jgi:hypothetical protein
MTDWDVRGNDSNFSKKVFDFSLQMPEPPGDDSICHMIMVIKELTITQRAIKLGMGSKGSIMVLPAGTMITLSSNEAITAKSVDEANLAIYGDQVKILSKLKGDTVYLSVNPRGELKQVDGIDQIFERITTETGFDRRTVNQILYDHISSPAIYDLFDRLFFYLPGRKIQQGDRWVKDKIHVVKAPMKYSHLITATDIKENAVHLQVRSVVSDKLAEDGVQHLEGEMTGDFSVNYSTGMPERAELKETSIMHTDHYDINRIRYFAISYY